ncbi:hypothetical protein AVEN_147016-1 [Araneus ventricosus]|uniref:Uncharacterized protein n=1 Tax=Araneus ventricosus TaxID=182803 RepID=A0A4Y2GSZ6_ARAVE|nr:hypothetical protein AVEN_147016-1 [Araneus ventricosus]
MITKLSQIQRPFLLNITGAYRTSPTAALQAITGIMPLDIKLEAEASFTSFSYMLSQPQCTKRVMNVSGFCTIGSRLIEGFQLRLAVCPDLYFVLVVLGAYLTALEAISSA